MSYLDLDNLSKSFKDDKIISNLNAKIEKGEFFVVFGPSGSGKGTIAKALALKLNWNYLDSGLLYRCFAFLHSENIENISESFSSCLLYTSPSPRDRTRSRMPSSA